MATASNEKNIEQVKKMFNINDSVEKINQEINANEEQNVIFTSGIMDTNHQALPSDFEFNEGVSKIYSQNNAYYVVKVIKLIPESIKTLNEVRGLVINDFQQALEKQWIEDLKNKYKVTINQDALNKIKEEINN